MLKRIHLPLSIYFVAGLVVGINLINFTPIKLCYFFLFITLVFIKKQWLLKIFNIVLFSIILGYGLANMQVNQFNDFKSQINHQTFSITGTVINYDKIEDSIFKHRLIIKTSLFSNHNQQLTASKKIAIYTKIFPKVFLGEEIIVNNLKFNFSNDQYFQDYLIKNQLAATAFVANLDFKVLKVISNFLLAKYKQAILKKINFKMNDSTKIMFNSIFAGYKNNHKNELNQLKNNFQTWGIIHYLARSGLHLVIISTIWQTICTILQIPIMFSNLIILLFMLIFYTLTWSALPFMRALIMIICCRVCQALGLQIHLLHILNISCILTLLNNPISIFFLDFQLSFLLTYGLIFFNEISYMKNKYLSKISIDCKK